MSLLFIKNKSHLISDTANDHFCEIERVTDASDFADMLYDLYRDDTFNQCDWVIVRESDFKRVLTRILKSDKIKIIRYCDDTYKKEVRQAEKKQKNQLIKLSDEDTTKIMYGKRCYDFGYDVNPNDLLDRVKESSLFDMSDLLEICNELRIEIDWKRLNREVVDPDRVTKERRNR